MEKERFQIILYVVFGFLIVVGFGSLALYGQLKKNEKSPPSSQADRPDQQRALVQVLVWGTLDAGSVNPVFRLLRGDANKGYDSVRYVEKDPESIEDEYVRVLAYDEQAPDLFILESGEVSDFESLLTAISFGQHPITSLAEYQQIFIPSAATFLRSDRYGRIAGYIALPFLLDSMVLYYNRNLQLQNNIRDYELPKLWSDFTNDAYQALIKKYKNTDTAVAPFGAYGNYANAPYLLAALVLQAKEAGGVSVSDVLTFYTNFANARSSVYTWSEAFLKARNMFVGGRLLFYPGFASEYEGLRRGNPNMVVRAVPLPQLSAEHIQVVPARLYAFAVPEKSRQFNAAIRVAHDIAGIAADKPLRIFNAVLLPPPVRGRIGTGPIPCTTNDQCPSESCDLDSGSCVLFPPGFRCSHDAQCLSNSCSAIRGTCDPVPQRVADEKVFIDSVFPSRGVSLSPGEQASLLESIRGVVTGVRTPSRVVETVQKLFQ